MGSNLDVAKIYLKKGLSVIPLSQNKAPAIKQWKPYQYNTMPIEEVNMHSWTKIGMLCGAINGSMEVIDVDTKFDLTGNLWKRLSEAIEDKFPGLLKKLVIAKTMSGGYHIIYKCDKIEGNQKLALRPPTDAELSDNPNIRDMAVIETRGTGGFIAIAPSEGYSLINGEYTQIPLISIEDRNSLFEICASFSEVKIEKRDKKKEKKKLEEDPNNPFRAYNDSEPNIGELLKKHGWQFVRTEDNNDYYLRPGKTTSKTSGNWSNQHNVFICFSSAAGLPTEEPLDAAELYTQLEHDGNKKESYKSLIKLGFGSYPRKEYSDSFFVNKVYDAKTDLYALYLDIPLLFSFLNKHGYYKLYRGEDHKPVFVHSEHNIVSISSASRIKDFLIGVAKEFDYQMGIAGEKLDGLSLTAMVMTRPLFNQDTFFWALPNITIDPLVGSADKDYLFFRNGILEVTKDNQQLKSYKESGKMIWKTSIQDRNYVRIEDNSGDYKTLLEKLSKGSTQGLKSAIGYLLSTFKDVTEAKCIILNDETIVNDPQGGSGKDLLLSAVEKHREVIRFDGKNWKADDSFAFQGVSESTHLIILDDVAQYFKFEKIFPLITGALSVNPKGVAAFKIPFEISPKFAITTNYVVQGSGDSHERRKVDYEIKKVYGANYTPMDDFNKRLFDDWAEEDWFAFDNFMVECLQVYLNENIIRQGESNIPKKRFIAATSYDFYTWASHALTETNKFYISTTERGKYMEAVDMEEKDDWGKPSLSTKRFAKWTEEFGNFMGYRKVLHRSKSAERGFIYLNPGEEVKLDEPKSEKSDTDFLF